MKSSMMKFVTILFIWMMCIEIIRAAPDSAGVPPDGFAYGGIPYGSMSGNVAEYYRMKEAEAVKAHVFPTQYVAQPALHYSNYYSIQY